MFIYWAFCSDRYDQTLLFGNKLTTMKSKILRPNVFLIALLVGLNVSYLCATEGYFSLGYGARHKGVAGAGISLYHFSLANGNPAGHVHLKKQFEVGLSFFNPNREFTVTGNPSGLPNTFGLTPGTTTSDTKLFLIPRLAGNWHIGDNSAFSVSIFGNGGMNTNYPTQVFYDQGSSSTGVNLAQLFANLTYSMKLSDNHSVGVTAVLAFQQFEMKGVSTFAPFSSDATKLSGNGVSSATGFGFKLGYMGQLSDAFSLGLMYQSKVNMGAFEEYAGLFAEQGDFDVPASWTAGIAYKLSDKLTGMIDVKQIFYSKVNSVGNPINPMALPPAFLNPGGDPNNPMDYTPNPNYTPLGSENGSGFGWEDVTSYKIAFEYDASENWMFRGGFSSGNNPITSSEVLFNILAPGVIRNHIALGLSRKLANGKRFDVSLNYALSSTISGPNPFDFDPVQAASGVFVPNQTIELKMNQLDIEFGYTF